MSVSYRIEWADDDIRVALLGLGLRLMPTIPVDPREPHDCPACGKPHARSAGAERQARFRARKAVGNG